MKNIIYFLIFSCFACQQNTEFSEEISVNTNTKNSETTNLYKRTSMLDGSLDDIIDANSCALVQLPITVLANNISLTIATEADYILIENIFNQLPTDTDTLVLNYPITVTLYDYTEVVLNNTTDLAELKKRCDAIPLEDRAISCIDLGFPLKIQFFNTLINQSFSETILSKKQLFQFMTAVSSEEVFSIQYPIDISFDIDILETIDSDLSFKNNALSCSTN
ncbi:hypothetical protein [Flavicella sediminum]|uniref:hypothetical protein n=1 Tax=Flavicella sediminum TaxID=2585141 RepID=UPI001122C647|nr:hypothetical protein [Flavicella sediminum]